MAVISERFDLQTRGNNDTIDITPKVARAVERSGLQDGIATVFVPGSTGGVTTIEYESGVVQDLGDSLERLVPSDIEYRHNLRWGDGNGHAHVRASLMGPSLTVPFGGGRLMLGTWQQIVFVDFDNRSRRRELIVQIIGESNGRG
jgi:secondary thiamine-phosphate synthase enzyme